MLKKIRIVSVLLFIADLDFGFMPNNVLAHDKLLEQTYLICGPTERLTSC